MAEQKETTAAIHNVPQQSVDNTVTLRVPKPNIQIVVLGLVAFITLFQTFQLIRISSANNTAGTVKSAPAPAANSGSGTGGSGTDANAPQSMVGGC